MSLRARLAAVAAVAVLIEATLGTLVLISAGPTRIAVYLLVCAGATLVLMALAWKLLDGPSDDPGGDDGPPGDGPPPPWWPAFERDFRRYADDRDRAKG